MENSAMTIMNDEMQSLMTEYNELMLDFAEASMKDENYSEKYEKREKCRMVKVQIELLNKIMAQMSTMEIKIPMMAKA